MSNPNLKASSLSEAVARLEACRLFEGPVKDFWQLFARTCSEIAGANGGRVIVRSEGQWRLAAAWPDPCEFAVPMTGAAFEALAGQALNEGLAASPTNAAHLPGLLLLALSTGEEKDECLFAATLVPGTREALLTAGNLLRLAADTPLLYQRQRQLERSKRELVNFSQALEVLAATNVHTRFLGVAMALVNELAVRHRCTRVSLSWRVGSYLRVQAVSGTDNFEKRMAVVQRLEAAMEEARDQDEEILWPPLPDSDAIVRDHQAYAETERVVGLLSVPVRIDGEPRGVLTLERTEAFGEFDALALRVVADQVARRLDDLRAHDRWFGARWVESARPWFSQFLGPKNTWLKVAAIVVTLFLLFSVFVPLPYRVDGSFIVRAEQLMHLPAPYDGYLGAVKVRPGDLVKAGEELVRLDTSNLLIELASAQAERQRYASEAEKAEADRKLSDMRAGRALEAQAQARVNLIRYRLDRAVMKAPFDGVVVEGDLRERLGAPVRAGDVLLKFSQLKGLYVEMRVPERDVDLIGRSKTADIAFTTRPEDNFQVRIDRLEPSAVPDREGNFFVLRGQMSGTAEWLRPGMTGVAKVEAGHRSFLWIATHRLIDFLRLRLWW
ncbi:efflux RND transporter periplasmic adaptor subunit [Oleiharenicola lentus]|uniref:efflux RND transporter periplasmic adaptor subunit n=1 Tax=Oleiharenicola lentus TaxID=2508720 RepID=UPI003F669ADC